MRNFILRARILACAAAFLAVFSAGCRDKSPEESGADKSEPNAVEASVVDGVVVTINGAEITESQIDELIRPQLDSLAAKPNLLAAHVAQYAKQFRQQAMEQLIRKELLGGKIRQANIVITDEDVMGEITQIAWAEGLLLDDFVKAMEEHGRNIEQMKQDLRERLARNRFMETLWAGKINVTEDDARKFYEENPEQFKIPEQIRVSHVLIMPEEGADPNEAMAKARKRAEDLLKKIKDGADFAEIAKANSACLSAPKGGDLDFFARGKATPEFEKAAFELEVGQISDVVGTNYGFHIIKATDHKDPADITFEQAGGKIIEQLTQEKQSEFVEAYLKKLKEEAKIVYPADM